MVGAEDAESLPAAVKAVASRVLGVGRVEETRKRLTDTIRDIGLQLEQWHAAVSTWQRLREIARQLAEPIPPPDADPVRTAEAAKAQASLPHLRQELADLAPTLEAKKAGKLFSKAFWKVTFNGDLVKRAEELEGQIRQAERTLASVAEQTPLPMRRSPDPALLDEFRRQCATLAAVGLTPPPAATPEAIDLAEQCWRQLSALLSADSSQTTGAGDELGRASRGKDSEQRAAAAVL